jgi:hypothetical protein
VRRFGFAGLIVGLVAAGGVEPSGEHPFVGADECKVCHGKELMGDQYAEWKNAGYTSEPTRR